MVLFLGWNSWFLEATRPLAYLYVRGDIFTLQGNPVQPRVGSVFPSFFGIVLTVPIDDAGTLLRRLHKGPYSQHYGFGSFPFGFLL